METEKKWYASRVLWSGVIAEIVALINLIAKRTLVSGDMTEVIVSLVMAIIPILVIIFRARTNQVIVK